MPKQTFPQWATPERRARLVELFVRSGGLCVFNGKGCAHHDGDVGEVEGRVALRRPSEHEGAIAFNAKYLLDYLEDKSGPVVLETNSPNAPGVWSVAGQPKVLLMPMFVQQDAPPVPSPEASPANGDVTEASEESENGESATLREEGESEIPE